VQDLSLRAEQGLGYAPDPNSQVLATDTATVTIDAPGDAAYNRSYNRTASASPPATWPIRYGRITEYQSGGFSLQSAPQLNGVHQWAFMADNASIAIQFQGFANEGFMAYVDGRPLSLSPYKFVATKTQFVTIVFASNKPRLVEIVTQCGVAAIYTKKPGTLWKPEGLSGPKVMVVGDSYTQPAVFPDTGSTPVGPSVSGAMQQLANRIGVEEVLTNGVGGTGYIRGDVASPNFVNRIPIVTAVAPDVLIVGGGGSNDLSVSQTQAAIIAQVVTYFQTVRAALPNCKLVFMEGFAPPVSFSSFNAAYTNIRAGAQAALTDVGVYYVDIATTEPWIKGLGYVTNPNADTENSSTYIGSDGIHPTIAGHTYIRNRLAPKLRRILRDNGELVNTLI
jgi:lysophospholipase L1-like esterase